MFERDLMLLLKEWAGKLNRKPLVLRGARQVGKTTLVNLFAGEFEQYIYLNLEKTEDIQYFKNNKIFDDLIQALFLSKNMLRKGKKTLIFIDEIQESPEAVHLLRYFYELAPDIYVISAGSRLSGALKTGLSFPVGRVEYLTLYPVTFPEFLNAMGESEALNQLNKVPLAGFAHETLLKLFHTYTLIGGMPEIVRDYAHFKDFTKLRTVYESLMSSFIDDTERYVHYKRQVQIIIHAIRSSFSEAGKRIKFEGFGQSNYKSREMGEALRKLERALLICLIYPTTQTSIPAIPDKRKSPRLQVLDTGLVNYFNGLQVDLISQDDLNQVYKGLIAEHIVGQELTALQNGTIGNISFWVREKKESQAAVDFIHLHKGRIIPIEVKSGSTGKLKSLHLFMDQTNHNLAVRFYNGQISIDQVITPSGKSFNLINLPYYLVSKLDHYLDWASSFHKS